MDFLLSETSFPTLSSIVDHFLVSRSLLAHKGATAEHISLQMVLSYPTAQLLRTLFLSECSALVRRLYFLACTLVLARLLWAVFHSEWFCPNLLQGTLPGERFCPGLALSYHGPHFSVNGSVLVYSENNLGYILLFVS